MKRSKEKEDEILMDLQRGSVPLDADALEDIRTASVGLSVCQTGTLVDNELFDLDSGGSGYMLRVGVGNDSKAPIYISEFRLEIPWHEPDFSWLSDPSRVSPRASYYSFPSPGAQGFDRDVVLNHKLGSRGLVNPGATIDGILLGIGQAPMPSDYLERQRVSLKLSIFDRSGRAYSNDFDFRVSRRSKRSKVDLSAVRLE